MTLRIILPLIFGLAFFLTPVQAGFIERNGASLSREGEFWIKEFTIDDSARYVLYFTPRYEASCFVAKADQLDDFKKDNAFGYVEAFIGSFGNRELDLDKGKYFLAVRNEVNRKNNYSVELERWPRKNEGRSFIQGVADVAETLATGAAFTQGFRITEDFSLLIEGCSSGCTTFIIPASEADNFAEGRNFRYHSKYSKNDFDDPGAITLDLLTGDYFVVVRNDRPTANNVTFRIFGYSGDVEPDSASKRLATAQPSLPYLGLPSAVESSDGWWRDPSLGFIYPLGDGWFYLNDTKSYYWSGRFGNFDDQNGAFFWSDKEKDFVFTQTSIYPQAFFFNREEFGELN